MARTLPTRSLLAAALLSSLVLTGCVTAAKAPVAPVPEPTPVAAGPAANDNLNAVAWQQTSVEYRLIAGQTWRSALAMLDKAIKSPDWDALPQGERENPARGLPLAVIVDIDETMLDNSIYQARLVRDGRSYDEFTWDQWVREEVATPVPGALEFAKAAAARGVRIFYVTNRVEHLGDATRANLRRLGFPLADDGQFLGLGTVVDGCEADGSDKACRRRLVGRTHRVLLQAGDQLGDFVALPDNSLAGREKAVRPYLGWVGERWFVLPNPTYGSWEPALFDNDWRQPEEVRRERKRAALDIGNPPPTEASE
jgi:5'-nucleotidase (lipoprotein e(P4) family)